MELLEIVFVRKKSIPRSCWNFEALFSLKLASENGENIERLDKANIERYSGML
jgi:hypothetical protein